MSLIGRIGHFESGVESKFAQTAKRVARTYKQGAANAVHEKKYPTPYGDTYLQKAMIRRGKAKYIGFRNTSIDATKLQ